MLTVLDHPLITHRLARLRAVDTPCEEFRSILSAISSLMVPAVTERLGQRPASVETPLETFETRMLASPIVLAPIMRAGLALLDGFHALLPEAAVAHVGVARDEQSLQPQSYYWNPPGCLRDADVIVIDPMLATGGSAIWTISQLKEAGAPRVHFACVVAAPEGLQALQDAHPDVPITCAVMDRALNEHGYIVPGLGDAGDRAFGTT